MLLRNLFDPGRAIRCWPAATASQTRPCRTSAPSTLRSARRQPWTRLRPRRPSAYGASRSDRRPPSSPGQATGSERPRTWGLPSRLHQHSAASPPTACPRPRRPIPSRSRLHHSSLSTRIGAPEPCTASAGPPLPSCLAGPRPPPRRRRRPPPTAPRRHQRTALRGGARPLAPSPPPLSPPRPSPACPPRRRRRRLHRVYDRLARLCQDPPGARSRPCLPRRGTWSLSATSVCAGWGT